MDTHSPSWFILSQKATANLQQSALIPALLFTSLALLVVLLRWYSRICLAPGKWGVEDYFISVALLLSISMTAVVGAESGLDMAPATDEQSSLHRLSKMLKLIFAHSLLYQLSVNLVKAGFTLQYLRIFSHLQWPRYYCYVLLLLILGATAWGVFGIIFLCNPVNTYWDGRVDGECKNAEHHFLRTGILGIVIDWAIWVLPMPIVGKLKLPRRQKWGLWVVFGLGGFVCIVSILRLTLVQDAARRGNMTASGTHAAVWSTIEVNVAIICASALVMKPLFTKWLPAIVSEQPMSASEDRRQFMRLTGLAMLNGGSVDEMKAREPNARRDTGVGMGPGRRGVESSQVPVRAERRSGPSSSTGTSTNTSSLQ
ncbi:uncharacterized protein EKO05_0010222 [Ascochyta rabiei]|uniref:uncharacterized protein n=1 Tax=Didymella rabiei TaxID=5454 RepID=UPI0022013DD2|nr:uncharacterized protein EKO05_0010222 [Ascochyta rabiei]UPX19974.1 hypothetical protein EKO05_0010222 [Ascochyta rabiei]